MHQTEKEEEKTQSIYQCLMKHAEKESTAHTHVKQRPNQSPTQQGKQSQCTTLYNTTTTHKHAHTHSRRPKEYT